MTKSVESGYEVKRKRHSAHDRCEAAPFLMKPSDLGDESCSLCQAFYGKKSTNIEANQGGETHAHPLYAAHAHAANDPEFATLLLLCYL